MATANHRFFNPAPADLTVGKDTTAADQLSLNNIETDAANGVIQGFKIIGGLLENVARTKVGDNKLIKELIDQCNAYQGEVRSIVDGVPAAEVEAEQTSIRSHTL